MTAGDLMHFLSNVPEDCEVHVCIEAIEGNRVTGFVNLAPADIKAVVLITEGTQTMKKLIEAVKSVILNPHVNN
jgi:hypothetical protein